MQPAAILNILVTANTAQASKGLMRVNTQLVATQSQANKALGAVKTLSKGAAIGATVAGVAATKLAVDFDRSMRNVNSIAGLSEKQFQSLNKRVLALAGPTGQAPKTLADGLYSIVSSGFKANDAMKILRAGAISASAGLTDTATATKAVTAVLNAYHRPASDARKVSDSLFQTVNLGVLSFEDLAQSIGDTLPFAAQVGINLEGVGAAITTMTRQGLSAPETMTRIRNVIVTLLKPGDALKDVFKQLGVEGGPELIKKMGGGRIGLQRSLEAISNTTGGAKDLQKAFKDLGVSGFDELKKKSGSASRANALLAGTLKANQSGLAKLFPNIRALGGALALTGKNTRSAEKDLQGFANTSGATAKVFAEQSKSVSLQFQKLKADVSALAIRFASKLLPELSKVIKVLSDPNLTPDEKLNKLGDMFSKAIAAAGPAVAKATAKIGLLAVRAFFNAFRESPLWFKLITSAFIINRLGGFDAMKRSGLRAGAAFGTGIAAGVAPGVARMQKEIAAAQAGANVGQVAAQSRAGRMVFGQTGRRAVKGKVFRSGEPISQIGARQYGLGRVAGGIADQARKIAPQVRAIGANVLGVALFAGIADAATRQGVKGLGDRFQTAASDVTLGLIPQPKAIDERLATIAKKIRDWKGGQLKLSDSSDPDNSLIRAKDLNDFTDRQRKMLTGLATLRNTANSLFGKDFKFTPKIEANPEKATAQLRMLANEFGRMKAGAILNLKDLRQATSANFQRIADTMGTGSHQGQQAVAKNFRLAVASVVDFRKRGILNAAQAGQTIATLMKNNTGRGKDALEKNMLAAEKAIARTMSRGGQVTRQGTALIRSLMVQALQDMGLSADTIRMSLDKKASARKGFTQPGQTGLIVSGGRPTGDSVHAILERGEVVINRTAVQKMGGPEKVNRVNQQIPRFQTGGIAGMVSAANKVDAAQFPYKWGGGHQGSPAPFGPFDCSGAVSYVLQHGGVRIPTMVSGALAGAGQAGPGAVTVFANPTHTFMRIGQRYFGTSGSNPGGGAGWFPDPGSSYRSRFTQRHFDARGFSVPRLLVDGPASLVKADVQGALDNTRRGANRALRNVLFNPIGSGDAGDPGPFGRSDPRATGRTRGHGFQKGGIVGWPHTPINVATAAARGAGFRGSTLANMVAIAGRESHWNPRATNLVPPDHSIGLWQINQLAHKGRFGSDSQLMIPTVNARAAKSLFDSSGYGPWVGVNYGNATQYLDDARRAIAATAGASGGGKTRKKPGRSFFSPLQRIDLPTVLGPTGKALKAQMALLTKGADIAADMASRAETLGAPVNGRSQTDWLNQQLSHLFRLRNTIIDAIHQIQVRRMLYAKAIASAKKQLSKLGHKKPKQRKALLRAIAGYEKNSRNLNARITGPDGLMATLEGVQGLGSPMNRMTVLPKVGVLGGQIFEVQTALSSAAQSVTDNSPVTDSATIGQLQELLRQANLRTSVSEAQFKVFQGFPQFATGGIVQGPVGMATPAIVHGGEGVFTKDQMASLGGGGDTHVHLKFSPGTEWLRRFVQVEVESGTRRQARTGSRGLPSRGGGF